MRAGHRRSEDDVRGTFPEAAEGGLPTAPTGSCYPMRLPQRSVESRPSRPCARELGALGWIPGGAATLHLLLACSLVPTECKACLCFALCSAPVASPAGGMDHLIKGKSPWDPSGGRYRCSPWPGFSQPILFPIQAAQMNAK